MQIRKILAPTDFSDASKQAIAYAFAWAQQFGAKLVLLHVIELPAYAVEGFVPPSTSDALLEDLERFPIACTTNTHSGRTILWHPEVSAS